jgi:hypothetical protein
MKHTKQTTWELYAKTIRMRAAEKRALRERIVSYMEYHPMRVPLADAAAAPQGAPASLASEPFVTMRLSSWQFRTFAGVFSLMFMIGVPAFAERSVPGDALYLMKVNVNEEVLGSLTWDSAGKVAWEAERVERRIAEARLLAQEGKLTEETEAQLAETVREHTESASREIATLRETDAESAEVAQAALESTLEVQTAMLATETSSSSPAVLALVIEQVKEGVSAHDPSLDGVLSPEKLTALLEIETTRARELLASVSKSITDEERTNIERRIADVERAVADARIMHETGRRSDGLAQQRVTLGDIQKLIEYMTNIDVRAAVALETLVPMKFTPEERIDAVAASLMDLRKAAVNLESDKVRVTDQDVLRKFARGQDELSSLITMIEDAQNANDIDAAERHIATGKTLVGDLSSMIVASDAALAEGVPNLQLPENDGEGTASTTVATSTATTTPAE